MKDILLLGKKVVPEKSKLLLDYSPDDNFEKYFMPLGGRWEHRDGWLHGIEPGNKGGILLSRESFDKNVMFSFTMASVLPATRDLNALCCTQWDNEKNYLKSAYICGINGWYDHKSGIEKFPENGLNATTPLYPYNPGDELEMCFGVINGHSFMTANNQLICELIDPEPLTGGHVGFSPYCTHLKVKNLKIYEIYWELRNQSYAPEFQEDTL